MAGAVDDRSGGPCLAASTETTSRPLHVRGAPAPLHGGPLALLRFMRRHGMLNLKYARLIARWAWLKLRWRGRLQTDGLCFVGPGVKFEIGRDAVVRLGRWSWIGHGTQDPRPRGRGLDRREDRARPGVHDLRLPARVDRARVHRRRPRDADRLRPRRRRGGPPDPPAGHLQARRATSATTAGSATARASCAARRSATTRSSAPARWSPRTCPPNAVAGGVPARILRMREEPETLRWGD